MPTEILSLIFENLDIAELYQIMEVNSRWREVAHAAFASKFKDTTLKLWMDQEGHRPYRPIFEFEGYNATTKLMRFVPMKTARNQDLRNVFNTAFGISRPALRFITVGKADNMDYLERDCEVSVKNVGRKTLLGSEAVSRGIPSTWSLSYIVEKYVRDGRRVSGERWFIPDAFECSIGFLNPNRAHKAKLLWYLKKSNPFTNQTQRRKVKGEIPQEDYTNFMYHQMNSISMVGVH